MLAASSAVIDLVSVDDEQEEKKQVAASPPPKKRKHTEEKEDDAKPTTHSQNVWNCPLCFDGFEIEGLLPCVLTSCGHMFCATCILSCPKEVCPFCRKDFKKTDVLPLRGLMKTNDAIAQATLDMNFDAKNDSSSSSVRVTGEELFRASVQLARDLRSNHIFEDSFLRWRIETSFTRRAIFGIFRIPYDDEEFGDCFGGRNARLRAHYLISVMDYSVFSLEFGREFSFIEEHAPYFDSSIFRRGLKKEERRRRLNLMYRPLEELVRPLFTRIHIRVDFVYYDETLPIQRNTKFHYLNIKFTSV